MAITNFGTLTYPAGMTEKLRGIIRGLSLGRNEKETLLDVTSGGAVALEDISGDMRQALASLSAVAHEQGIPLEGEIEFVSSVDMEEGIISVKGGMAEVYYGTVEIGLHKASVDELKGELASRGTAAGQAGGMTWEAVAAGVRKNGGSRFWVDGEDHIRCMDSGDAELATGFLRAVLGCWVAYDEDADGHFIYRG